LFVHGEHSRRERVERQQGAHPGILRDHQDLPRRVQWVDVDYRRAQSQDGEGRNEALRAVWQHDADAVTFCDSETRECRGQLV
jgi:hypothetical protein